MPESIIPPTSERQQHDTIDVRPAGRKNNAQIYVQPFWHTDRWKKILSAEQIQVADMFVQDHEQISRGPNSCLASLDRIDHAGGPVLAETASGAQERINAVRARLPLHSYSILYAVLIYGSKPDKVTNQHHSVAQGMIIAMLDVLTVVYGLKS